MNGTQAILVLSGLLPLALFGYLGPRLRTKTKKTVISEKLPRPPGYTASIRLAELTEQFNDFGMLTLIFLTGFSIAFGNTQQVAVVALVFAMIGAIPAAYLFQLATKIRNLKLGVSSEMIVGEMLNELRADGYAIYHDFPTDYGNIDHIIVGRSGVYAVETKARRKSFGEDGYKVTYRDGALHFPRFVDKKMIPQAQRQADWLQKYLSRPQPLPVPVSPVLTIPGWFIQRPQNPPIAVVAPKELIALVRKGRPVLNDQELKRLRFDVEQKVRDVEV